MNPVEIGSVPEAERTQSSLDLFLIWAGADIVATTFAVGASLAGSFDTRTAMALMIFGSLGGALMYVINFAWIAINNVIAASACAALWGGPAAERWWAFGLGVLSTLVVAGGPRWVVLTDRVAVPLLFGLSLLMTAACLRLEPAPLPAQSAGSLSLLRGLDVVFGYQASWILMFADYSRYTRSGRASFVAVFLGLGLTSAWLMPLGYLAARTAGSPDPAAMLDAVGLGIGGGLLMSFGTVTTNFVNIYLSALAWKSLLPRSSQQTALWVTGLVGAALSLLSRAWLDRYADFMLLLGGAFVPVGGILIARFFFDKRPVDVAALYDSRGEHARHFGFSPAGLLAWGAGAIAFYTIGASGGTFPALAVAVIVYVLARRAVSGS